MTQENVALLPLFKPSPLDSIPIYSLVLQYHDLLELKVDMRYDQLRSPQVNALLIKPLLTEIKEDVSEGSLYALLACMAQFRKEASTNVAMVGVSTTRAMICEIVATKLLKEYEDEELINALTYDFYPLSNGKGSTTQTFIPRWLRISTIELAINAEAKKFLAHPVVTQVIEEIWNGSIMFQSSLNKLHRIKFSNEDEVIASGYGRRGPGVRYDYSETSMLKLSRLRVPRYRNILNMISFCILLALYIKVLSDQEKSLGAFEVIFGLWSLGFILDELVAFTDLGFQLYVMSLWNLLDVAILSLLVTYAVFRTLALRSFRLGYDDSNYLFKISRDILASIAIFLFPRLFSILDNYESFSKMVVAVRKMSLDLLVAWVVLVVFSCGFWVAFTMAFARDVFSANEVAFDLLKILFGFTPAVWQNWEYYSYIGRCILLFYLFITHFVILTILIAVLSDSFAHINENSTEEHRFLFAVNTISMIKAESSSLFSYTPPLNLIEWAIRPLFYFISLRRFLVLNRTIIKLTHFPVLIAIFIYERIHYQLHQARIHKAAQDETARQQAMADAGIRKRTAIFQAPAATSGTMSPRKRGAASSAKIRDRVSNMDLLDEVFKRPYKGTIKIKRHIPSQTTSTIQPSATLVGTGRTPSVSYAYGAIEGDRMSDVMQSDLEYGRRVFESDYEEENSDNDIASTTTRDTANRYLGPQNLRSILTHRDSIVSALKPSMLSSSYRRRSSRRKRDWSKGTVLTPVASNVAMDTMSRNAVDSNYDHGDYDANEEGETTIQDLFRAYRSRQHVGVAGREDEDTKEDDESENDPYEDGDGEDDPDNNGDFQSFAFDVSAEEAIKKMQRMMLTMNKQLENIAGKLEAST